MGEQGMGCTLVDSMETIFTCRRLYGGQVQLTVSMSRSSVREEHVFVYRWHMGLPAAIRRPELFYTCHCGGLNLLYE